MESTDDVLNPERDEDTMKGKYLIFSMGNELYGIEIRFITEIIGIQPIIKVPEMPVYVKGITNLRGKIIPVMDARMRFGQTLREYDDRTCIVVIDGNNVTTGLIVDRVLEVISMKEEDIAPPLDCRTNRSKLLTGFGKSNGKVNLLLDCQRLLEDESLAISF
jgi:purine-binding chemotaxis protein CheW